MKPQRLLAVLLLATSATTAFAAPVNYRYRVVTKGVVGATVSAPAAPQQAVIVNGLWSDGAYGESCLAYFNGDETHSSTTQDGTFKIKPAGIVYDVTCDMLNGGWTKFDRMVAGYMPFPGDGQNVITPRVLAADLVMYQSIAGVSTLQRIVGVAGQSEAGYDKYSFSDADGLDIPGTVLRSGPWSSSLDIALSKNWRKALASTRFQTDSSTNQGSGASIPSVSWFK